MKNINLETFIEMLKMGTNALACEFEYINKLNIFPVPDGDTGINMKSTSLGAFNAISMSTFSDFKALADEYSQELLLNARGNSGVIFSQIMKGFCESFAEGQTELNVIDLQKSFMNAKQSAYDSVNNPIEGTILTVIRLIFENTSRQSYDDINTLFNDVIKYGEIALESTREIMKQLKDVDTMDSGAYGLMSFLKGMNSVVHGNSKEYIEQLKEQSATEIDDFNNFEDFHENVEFGYCSEIILRLNDSIEPNKPANKKKFNKANFVKDLEKIGNSLVCVAVNDIVKVHIHTKRPQKLLEIAQKYGEFEKIKIENMTKQYLQLQHHTHTQLSDELKVLFTTPTENIATQLEQNYGWTDYLLTEPDAPNVNAFIKQINSMKTKNVLIIIDDANIKLTVEETIKYFKDKVKIELITTNNVAETLILGSVFDPTASINDNHKEMLKTLKNLRSAAVSISFKDVEIQGHCVKQNDFISFINKQIICASPDQLETLKNTFIELIKEYNDVEYACLIIGKNADQEITQQFIDYVYDEYTIIIEPIQGEQTIYCHYIGIM